jgi:TPR repeat protein
MAQPTQSERLFSRGERYLTEGNIVVARQYFLRAAQMGLARAAFKLAETYDPYVPERPNAHGVNADLAEAKRWYARAVELGAEDAKARLAKLGKE